MGMKPRRNPTWIDGRCGRVTGVRTANKRDFEIVCVRKAGHEGECIASIKAAKLADQGFTDEQAA